MKKLTTLIFGTMIALALSMPAWSQAASTKASAVAQEKKEEKKDAKKATKADEKAKKAAEMYDFWANKNDTAVNGILGILDSCQGECVAPLVEEVSCLLEESDMFRRRADDLRNKVRMTACQSTNLNAKDADTVLST